MNRVNTLKLKDMLIFLTHHVCDIGNESKDVYENI